MKDGQTLAQVTQEGREGSIPGYIQNPAGHSPRQPTAGDPALSGALDQMIPRGVLQAQLQLCERGLGLAFHIPWSTQSQPEAEILES